MYEASKRFKDLTDPRYLELKNSKPEPAHEEPATKKMQEYLDEVNGELAELADSTEALLRKLQYYKLKARYHQIMKNHAHASKFLWKMERLNDEQLGGDYRHRTDILLMMAKTDVQRKEVLRAHYQLTNWL